MSECCNFDIIKNENVLINDEIIIFYDYDTCFIGIYL